MAVATTEPQVLADGVLDGLSALVTGAGSGIGRAITEMALARGDSIVSIDRVEPAERLAGVEYIVGEVADYDLLVRAFAGADAMIHMAAIPAPFSHPDHVVHNNNVVGSYNAMRAAIENGIMRICQAAEGETPDCPVSHDDDQHARADWRWIALMCWIGAAAINTARTWTIDIFALAIAAVGIYATVRCNPGRRP